MSCADGSCNGGYTFSGKLNMKSLRRTMPAVLLTSHNQALRLWLIGRVCGIVGLVLAIPFATVGLAEESGDRLTSAQQSALATHFGFADLEVFKIEHGISELSIGDLNNDGLNDVVVANNSKSTLEVLLQRAEPPNELEEPAEVNDLVNHWRFERKPTSVTWEIHCIRIADLTGDGNADVVILGEPKELVLLPGKGDGTFDQAIVRRVRDAVTIPRCMAIDDLNGDGRNDVALLAADDVLIFVQKEGGGLSEVKRISHALDNVSALQLADFNGDGRADLALFTHDEDYPLRIQYQDELGNLGPMQRVKLPGLRSIHLSRVSGTKADNLFAVERVSGRLKRWAFDGFGQPAKSEEWAVLYYPLPGRSSSDSRPLAVTDVDGDGRMDVIGADVDGAQMVLFRQEARLGLLPAETFGGQVKMRDMRCFDVESDGVGEVFVLSAEEGFIARSSYSDSRLTFPKAIPTVGKPFAMDVVRLRPEAESSLTYVSRNDDGKYELVIQPATAASVDDVSIRRFTVDDLDEPPTAVRSVDVNRDGLVDVLVFAPYSPLIAFIQQNDGTFVSLGTDGRSQRGLVKQAAVEGFAYGDADGDGKNEILLAQGTFVRALYVNADGSWEILDQYNPPSSDVEIEGVALLPFAKEKRPYLVMYDGRGREIIIFKPAVGGAYKVDHSVQVGKFDLKAMIVAPLAGDDQPSIMLADSRRVALVLPNVKAAGAREMGSYESSIKDGWLMAIASGDVNHDGRTDVAVIDAKDHFVEILTFGPDESIVRGNKFRVFAKKQYHRRNSDAPEPRSIDIADLTNDGIDDLVLVAHDRILLYPGQ